MKRKYGFLFSLILLLMIPTTPTVSFGPESWTRAGYRLVEGRHTWRHSEPHHHLRHAQSGGNLGPDQLRDRKLPANQVVFLNAGTYTIASGINFGSTNNVTLRGPARIKPFSISRAVTIVEA